MTAPFFVPFNYQPVDTVFSSSRTLAAGEYAYCVPLSPACTVDGSYIFSLGTFTKSDTGARGLAPLNFTGRITTGAQNSNKSLGFSSVGFGITATGTDTIDAFFQDGSMVQVLSGTLGIPAITGDITCINITTANSVAVTVSPSKIHPIWLSNGEVLAGDNWIIHIYNKVT